MDRWARVGLGAALGALAALTAHPASRPFLLACFENLTRVPTPRHAVLTAALELQPPVTREDAAKWMSVGAMKMLAHGVSNAELSTLLDVADVGQRKDPDNAFWRQMSAVFLNALGKHDAADAMWAKAAALARWDDLQTPALEARAKLLADKSGAPMAWQDAYLFYQRSTAPATLILGYARSLLQRRTDDSKQSLAMRYATLVNGSLLREGARSVAIGGIGADIVEFSSHPASLLATESNRKLYVARFEFKEALRRAGMDESAVDSEQMYNNNDGWTALIQKGEAKEPMTALFGASVLIATLPSALLITTIVGMAIWFVGMLAHRFPALERSVEFPWSLLWSMAFGAVVGLITQFPLAGLASGLCGLFVSLSPQRERSTPPESLGPLFDIVICILSVMLIAIGAAFVIGMTTSATLVLPHTGVSADYLSGSSLYIGLGSLVFGALMVVAPLWAFAQRIRTAYVLQLGVAKFGATVAGISLAGAVILAPASVYADRRIGEPIRQLFLNEPMHYLTQ